MNTTRWSPMPLVEPATVVSFPIPVLSGCVAALAFAIPVSMLVRRLTFVQSPDAETRTMHGKPAVMQRKTGGRPPWGSAIVREEPLLPDHRDDPGGVLDGEPDLPAFILRRGEENGVAVRAIPVERIPGGDVAGTPRPPRACREGWFAGRDGIDIAEGDLVALEERYRECEEGDAVVGDPYETIGVKRAWLQSRGSGLVGFRSTPGSLPAEEHGDDDERRDAEKPAPGKYHDDLVRDRSRDDQRDGCHIQDQQRQQMPDWSADSRCHDSTFVLVHDE